MRKENNIGNNIIYSAILLPELPSSAILESTPERNQRNQRLNLWRHMDYFTDVLAMFLCVDRGDILAVYGGSESSRISSKMS